jgi:guanine nucleotide-binding protein G(i) subunit alpha
MFLKRLLRDPETLANAQATQELEKAALNSALKVQLLMLGAGGSGACAPSPPRPLTPPPSRPPGKTTLRKQIQRLFTNAFSTMEERKEVADIIVGNLLEGARAIIAASFEQGIGGGLQAEESLAAAKHINQLHVEEKTLTPATVKALQVLWSDMNFQSAIDQRSKFQLQECVLPFFKEVQTYPVWGGPEWIPSVDDCVRARIRSSGVIRVDFESQGVPYSLFDAGGQRAERRKWIQFFNDVTALVYMASLTDYDEVLYEDATKNRLQESLEVFDELCRTQQWQTLLFLNKIDLFEIKFSLKKIPLNVSGLFPTAPDTEDVDDAIEWMASLYKAKMWRGGSFFVHAVAAVDGESVTNLFEDMKYIVLKRAVGGLI